MHYGQTETSIAQAETERLRQEVIDAARACFAVGGTQNLLRLSDAVRALDGETDG